MNILEQEDQLKGMPDSMLLMEMEQPSGMYPPFLVASEQQRRNSMRENYAASEQQPTTTVVEQEFQKGLASMMPPSSPAPVAPNSLPPPIPVGGLSQGSMGAGDPVMANTGGQFPDLSGDGKITKKDILMGRGVVTMDAGRQVPAYATGAIESQQQAARDLDAGLAALARQGVSAAEATARYTRDAIMSLGRSIAAAEGSTRMFYPEYRDKDVPYSNPNSVAGDQAGILGEVLEGAGGLLLDTLPEAQEFPFYEQQFRDFSNQEGLRAAEAASEDRTYEDDEIDFLNKVSGETDRMNTFDMRGFLQQIGILGDEESDAARARRKAILDGEDPFRLQEIMGVTEDDSGVLDASSEIIDETPQDVSSTSTDGSFTPTDEQLLVFEDIVRRGSEDDDDAPFRMQGIVDNQNIPETRAVNTDLSRIIDEGQDLTKSRVEEIQDLIDRSRSEARSDAFYAAIGRIGAGIAKGDLGAGIDAGIGEMTGRQREQRRNELALQAQKMAAQDKDIDRRAKIIADIAGLDLSERRLQAIIDQNEDLNSRNDVARLNAVQRVVSDIFDPDEYVDEAARRRGYTMIFNAFASQYSVPTIPVPQGSASSGDTVQAPPLDNFYGQ